MELHLLRHGIAADPNDPAFSDDSQRPLTDEGLRKTRQVAHALARLRFTYDLILTSPLARAKQTADVVAGELGLSDRVQLCPALAPGGRPQAVVKVIGELADSDGSLLLVGHEPDLSRLASWLISGRLDARIRLKKAGLCVVETDGLAGGRCGVLKLLLPPRVLQRLA